jgi:phospholipase C
MQYIGRLFPGTLSFVDLPSDRVLADYTAQVVRNNGFDRMDGTLSVADATDVTPRAIPRRVGEPSLIKYVFYIIKENRTYDQVFGDLPQGEGDSTLTLFGRNVSPNHHALAENFVLFDNFYVDAEVSADGHEWSMGAIATDFVEKLWPTGYSSRGFPFVAEGSFEIAYPDAGYLWDAAARAGVTYRSYGEFVRYGPNRSYPVQTRLANLQGHVAPDYPPYDLRVTDVERAAEFIRDFEELVAGDSVPQLNIIRLPNDHTAGTRPGYPTPLSMMADNDLALGRIVEAISRSPIWDETAIFVVEDDSQNGPDHIDSHRTIALVASPYAKRGFVDHTMYDTVSMLKTMELILGLAPLSQYDAAAIPMVLAFQDEADTTPFTALPNRFPLDSLNAPDAFGAELSMRMNLEELDAAPEELLNEIIWKSVKGPASEMPRPHTTRTWIDLDGDDDEEKNEERH